MHCPPEVRFSVGKSPLRAQVTGVLLVLAALQVIGFMVLSPQPGWRTATGGAGLIIAASLAWFWTRQPNSGSLHFTGERWQWSGLQSEVCTLQLHLDFQSVLLVSLHAPHRPSVCLCLQPSMDPTDWLALRRAVVHSTRSGQPRLAHKSGPERPTASS